jgi:chromosome segregation ATPase
MKLQLIAFLFLIAVIGVPVSGILLSKQAQEAHTMFQSKEREAADNKIVADKLQSDVETHKKTIGDRDATISSLNKDLRALNASSSGAAERIRLLEAEVASHKETIRAQEIKISSLDKDLKALSSSSGASANRIKSLEDQLRDSEGKMNDLQKRLDAYAEALAVLNRHRPRISEEISRINSEDGKKLRTAFDLAKTNRPFTRPPG